MHRASSDPTRIGTLPGWRARASQVLVCGLLIVSAAANPVAAGMEPPVTVSEREGTYSVTATFTVEEPASVARAVLTDYDNIARFMPDVRVSTVRERRDGAALVEQEAIPRLLMFSKRVHLLLDVRDEGGTIRFRDRCGRSFSRYEGSWRIAAANGRTTITYELTAKPSFDVPEFILGRLLKRDAKKMIEGLRREMARRDTAKA